MSDTLSEFEEFLNWKKGKQSQERQEGILTEIRDSLKQLLEGGGDEGEGDEGGEGGTPPAPPRSGGKTGGKTGGEGGGSGEGGGTPGKRPSRWFGEATG